MKRAALLFVLLPCLLPCGPARAGAACNDDAITAVVKTRLAADHVIGPFLIEVSTSGCVVTLSGCVESRDQVRRAKEVAKRLVHVRVKNELTVCTIAPRRTKSTRR
ncbi:MAG: hypothetical protein AUI47_10745 [Acidobacteria bacterium 13_1_40CM_2_68_5]|nr:MAG: hypothetical protein AUI47_10745 [Acidobacteria bacterium 13_1_40CM_2_68_5]